MTEGETAAAAATERRDLKAQLDTIERLAIVLAAVLIGCSIAYSGGIAISRYSLSDFLLVGLLFVGLVVSSAIIGGLLGFLFGLPRLSPAAAPVDATAAAAKPSNVSARGFFKGNTNLEDISDWLTKIIVGVGLVESTKIYSGLGGLALKFQQTVLPGTAGPAMSLQAAFLIFGLAALVLGFMFVNLETRTRITMLLEDTETLRQGPRSDELKASIDAPITDVDLTSVSDQPAATALKSTSDDAVLAMTYRDLQTAEQFAAWGSAQARAGNFVVAARALNEAITREPRNVDYILKLAEIRQGQGDERGALVLLGEALSKRGSDPDLLKRVLLNALYLNPPEGFRTAIPILEQLQKIPGAADNPSVQVWAASAYGQKYRWSKQNAGSELEVADAKDKALAAAKRVVELSPAVDSVPRIFLRRLFDPARESSPPNENDLEDFKTDPAFRAIVYRDMPGVV